MTSASSLAGRATSGPRTGTDATGSTRDCAAAVEEPSTSAALTKCRRMAQECTAASAMRPRSRPWWPSHLRADSRWGDISGHRRFPMALPLALLLAVSTLAQNPTTAAWTLKMKGPIRWQQVTPAGALLVSTDASLAAVDIDRGVVTWEKPELGGLAADSVRMVEGSLLMEAARPGLLLVFDPVTGAVVFDSRRLSLVQVVTRRVLPQSGTLLVHGRRASGPPVIALFDLTSGAQRWASESLFQENGPKRGGLGGLMQGLVT